MNMDDYHWFQEHLLKLTGINLSLYKEEQMKRRLTTFRNKHGFASFKALFEGFRESGELYDAFLDHMTINVSEFFRNKQRWDILENNILPSLVSRQKRLKIWSAACSTGEEPYTMAMILDKHGLLTGSSILATDLDKRVLTFAKTGLYPERVIKEVTSKDRDNYFSKTGDQYQIDKKFRDKIRFRQHDLLQQPFESNFDVVICRNVLIYFTEEAKQVLYSKFSQALNDGGILFVGSTEQIFNPQKYNLKAIETFFYQKNIGH